METQTRIRVQSREIDPRKLKLLEQNAHFMRHETFQRLVSNMQEDGASTSTPFVWLIHDDETRQPLHSPDEQDAYLVLSGNHRVKGAIAADLPTIHVLYSDDYLPPDRRRAIQLSHNAVTGEDDPAILKLIYDTIENVDLRLYAGLDDKTLQLLDAVPTISLNEAQLQFQTVTMTFLPDEIETVTQTWDTLKEAVKGSKAVWLTRWADYDRALDALEAASASAGIRNTATAFMVILDIFNKHLEDLQSLYLTADGEPIARTRHVPLSTVLTDPFLTAEDAALVSKAIKTMVSRAEIVSPTEAILLWAKRYLDSAIS